MKPYVSRKCFKVAHHRDVPAACICLEHPRSTGGSPEFDDLTRSILQQNEIPISIRDEYVGTDLLKSLG
ncbi:hypothetical protein BJF95_07885 [Rhizobium oryziradicis]|uniref:Uncharacterized protein n=1 Tax=Rhizobium oryziradicis TaxID=1867956 RepID=A0A1Q8ZR62_9HYPH|nr:hypothetical protein BJF95_07885 [Rhizobium oryziradicis]